jgi:uncharacterized protein RhaS with RHS repeats
MLERVKALQAQVVLSFSWATLQQGSVRRAPGSLSVRWVQMMPRRSQAQHHGFPTQ